MRACGSFRNGQPAHAATNLADIQSDPDLFGRQDQIAFAIDNPDRGHAMPNMKFAPLSASSTVAQGAPLAFRGDKEICRHLPLPSWSPSLESRTRNDERRTRVACGDSETTHGKIAYTAGELIVDSERCRRTRRQPSISRIPPSHTERRLGGRLRSTAERSRPRLHVRKEGRSSPNSAKSISRGAGRFLPPGRRDDRNSSEACISRSP